MDGKNKTDKMDEVFNYMGLDGKDSTMNKQRKKVMKVDAPKRHNTIEVEDHHKTKSGLGTPGINGGSTTRNDNTITLNDLSPINQLGNVN